MLMERKTMAAFMMREKLKDAREFAKEAGFGYEIDDAIYELIEAAEFELDEAGVEYE